MITLVSSSITTLDEASNELKSVTQSGDGVITTDLNVISQRKVLKARFTVETADEPEYQIALLGSKLAINIAMFLPTGVASYLEKPQTGFSYNIPSDLTPSETPTRVEMPFFCTGSLRPEAVRNLNAWFYYYDTDDFAIEIEYYNRFDENGYLNATSKSSAWSFIGEQWNEPNAKMIDASVFSTDKDLRVLTYLENALGEGEQQPYSELQEFTILTTTVGRYDSAVSIVNGLGENLTYISAVVDTDITVRINATSETLTDFYLKLIKITEDSAYNFITNAGITDNQIIDSNAVNNVFKGPFDYALNTYDGIFYELTCTIDHTYIEAGVQYRIIAVGYDSSLTEYNIGISEQLAGQSYVPYCLSECEDSYETPSSLIFTGSLTDIHDEYFGNNLTAAIEERIRTKLIVDFSDDRWKNNLDCRVNALGSEILTTNDIRKYLNGVKLEFYHTYSDTIGTVVDTLDLQFINKTGVNTFNSPAISFAFDMTGETLTMYYDFRNRNETSASALSSTVNGLPYSPILGNQYWGGKSITIRWSLTFFYFDFPQPFTDTLYYTQTLNVRDYTSDVTLTPYTDEVFCSQGQFCIEAAIVFASPENYRLVATRQLNEGVITEHENFTPDNLGRQTDASMASAEDDYTGGRAVFCVDPSALQVGNIYKFSAMAKQWL